MDGEGSGQRLLAYLGLRYATHPENMATEALAWLLRRAPAAENGLRRLLGSVGFTVPDQVHWSTQSSESGKDGTSTIPDLVATDATGATPVVVEVKFWAGLTPNQPLGYLPRLPAGQPGILLFVAPAARGELLWGELTRIVRGAGHAVKLTADDQLRCAVLDDGAHRVALVSWRTLLDVLETALVEAGQREYAGDLAQLASLANRMDSEAFLPLTSEDLTGQLARRWLNYTRLVDDITARLIGDDPSVRKGPDGTWLGGSAASGWSGRYLNLAGRVCLLRVTAHPWAVDRATPLWLQVGLKGKPPVSDTVAALTPLSGEPGRVFRRSDFVDVAIDLPTGVFYDAVLDQATDQVRRVQDTLALHSFQ